MQVQHYGEEGDESRCDPHQAHQHWDRPRDCDDFHWMSQHLLAASPGSQSVSCLLAQAGQG